MSFKNVFIHFVYITVHLRCVGQFAALDHFAWIRIHSIDFAWILIRRIDEILFRLKD